jgi:hypothetical protein
MSPTEPDPETRKAEEADAAHAHTSDRPPTSDEVAAAGEEYSEEGEAERRKVADHYKEMGELGAEAKGEGRIE